jgi:hypothetical protein
MSGRLVRGVLAGVIGGVTALVAEQVIFPPPIIARVDVSALVAERLRAEAPHPETPEQAAALGRALDRELAQLAKDYRAVLIEASALPAGAPDLTAVLRARLAEALP